MPHQSLPVRVGPIHFVGIGGIGNWRDAAEFMVLGAGNVQVCTAAMTYGFKIVQEMISPHLFLLINALGQNSIVLMSTYLKSSISACSPPLLKMKMPPVLNSQTLK